MLGIDALSAPEVIGFIFFTRNQKFWPAGVTDGIPLAGASTTLCGIPAAFHAN